MRPFPLAASLCLALAAPVSQAATLRPATTLSAPVVLLSDLFDDAGANASRVLGPAPRPGERIIVEATQLAAIARQFNVDWRPSSGADRAVLEQPGRPLPREALLSTLHASLAAAGAPADCDIDLPDFDPPLIPLLTHPQASVEQLEYDRTSGRFTATVLISGANMARLPFSLAGHVEEMAVVATASRNLPAGSVIRPSDLRLARVRVSELRGDAVRDIGQASGLELHRPAPQGSVVSASDLSRPAAVTKGARVVMEMRSPGLLIMAQGVAMEAGALGERIAVLNPSSHMIIDGEIIARNRVAVSNDSAPVPSDAQVALR